MIFGENGFCLIFSCKSSLFRKILLGLPLNSSSPSFIHNPSPNRELNSILPDGPGVETPVEACYSVKENDTNTENWYNSPNLTKAVINLDVKT